VVPEIAGSSRAILADSWTAKTDEIVAARPDLVIASVPYQEEAVIQILRSGARFLGLAPKTLADTYTDIAIIAGAADASQRGEEVITRMQRRIEDVRKSTSHLSRPRVFCEEWGKPLIASQAWVAELVEAAGGEFIGMPGRQISFDDVANLNPQVLIAAWCGAGDRVPLEKIIDARAWQHTAAALAGRVFCIRDEYLNTPAPTLLAGLDALVFAIHPEVFQGSNTVSTKGIRQITAVSGSPLKNSPA